MGFNEQNERLNGLLAMLGIIAAMGCLCNDRSNHSRYLVIMTELLWIVTSISFFVLLSYSVEKLCETY